MVNLKLIGSRLTKVLAEKNPDFNGKMSMKTNIKVNSLEKTKESKDILKLSYTLDINYEDLGKILIEGLLFISGDQKSIKDLQKIHKEKNFESPEYIAITNLIIQKASIKAFELEEEMNLPIHIKLPMLSIKK